MSNVTGFHAAFMPHSNPQIGITSSLQAAVEFWLWTQSLHGEPTREAIQAHYGCSRATAYRYLSAYRNVASRFPARTAA